MTRLKHTPKKLERSNLRIAGHKYTFNLPLTSIDPNSGARALSRDEMQLQIYKLQQRKTLAAK
jgi:hypothetical protein